KSIVHGSNIDFITILWPPPKIGGGCSIEFSQILKSSSLSCVRRGPRVVTKVSPNLNDTIRRSMTASEPSTKRGVGCTKPTVSIVVPAFNEAARIGDSIRRIERFLETFSFDTDVIVVDDGSMDETARIIRELQFPQLRLISNTVNHGKGYAVKCGVLA